MPQPPASAHRGDERQPTVRPYGAWYPLVRVGHFLLMATTSCLIILAGLGVLAVLALLAGALIR